MRELTLDEVRVVGGGSAFGGRSPAGIPLLSSTGGTPTPGHQGPDENGVDVVIVVGQRSSTLGGIVGDGAGFLVGEFHDWERGFEPWYLRPAYDALAERQRLAIRNGVADFVNGMVDAWTQSEKDREAFWDPEHGVFGR